ncbi:MAG: hypothetical protein U5R31_07600 [Acidimicrobiia bacterium]|nr:hypothetical protein [Acidimicrobiia bacterium]
MPCVPVQRDLGIQVNTGITTGGIEIHTAGLGATKASDFWNAGEKTDPWKLPNAIPIGKAQLKTFKPYLDRLQRFIEGEVPDQPKRTTLRTPRAHPARRATPWPTSSASWPSFETKGS